MGQPKPGQQRKPVAKQLNLEGFKGKTNVDVEEAFDEYMEALAERASATKVLKDKSDALLRVMQKNKIPSYGKQIGRGGKKKSTWVAALVSEEDVVVKKQTKDRKQ
jgi:hypothetical protein